MADAPIGEVILKDVRLSFAHIYEPSKDSTDKKTGQTIKGSYQARGLMEKGTPATIENMKKLKKAGLDARKKEWGDNEAKHPKLKPNQLCVRDGDLEDWEGYEGCYYIAANAGQRKPSVITNIKGKDGKWIEATPGGANSPYSGCRVNMLVRIWAQDNEYGKRQNASLEIVQFFKDGEPFGAGPVDPNEKFGDEFAADGESIADEDEDDGGLI